MKILLTFLIFSALPAFAQIVNPGTGGGASGTVTSVSVTTANGVSGTVATPTTTPAITLTLGAITPTSTNGVSAATMAFMDATSSVQTQLNAKQASGNYITALTGDVTAAGPGSSASTIAANAVTGAKIANNTVTATQLAAQYSKGSCTEVWGGSGTSFALTSGDDAISNNTCYNDSGVTRTITAVKCRSSIASNTTTVNPTFGAAGTGTTILSGALTCGSSLAYSSTGTVSNASWTTGTGITPAMGGTLTGTSIAMIVEYTF